MEKLALKAAAAEAEEGSSRPDEAAKEKAR